MAGEKLSEIPTNQLMRRALLITLLNVFLHTVIIGTGVFNNEVQLSFLNSIAGGIALYFLIFPILIVVITGIGSLFTRKFERRFFLQSYITLQLLMVLLHLIVFIRDGIFF